MKLCSVEMEDVLRNWARWACGSAGGPEHRLSSLEGRYIVPDNEEDVRKRNYNPVDNASAERIEKIVRSLESRKKKLIKHYYIHRSNPNHVCRRMRISHTTYELELLSAHSYIAHIYMA